MTTFVITLVLLIAGLFAGLIQYFVDFKGLPIYQPPAPPKTESFSEPLKPDFWTRLLQFFKRNWQLFGYLIIGIAGAFLIPLIAELTKLPGVKTDFSCLGTPGCHANGWDLFILLGYGIISGYSSVRIIRSVGSLLIGNVSKQFQQQQQSMDELKNKITELQTKLAAVQPSGKSPSFSEAMQEVRPAGNYFDKAKNEIDKRLYYSGIDMGDKNQLFNKLSELLTQSHKSKLPYKPALHLYPEVDRYSDGQLRSIYSGDSFSLETLLEMDAQVDRARAEAFQVVGMESMSPGEYESKMEELEDLLPYNCEHVVPQSWFSKKEPMRGDLHHLFTCEMRCNSFRGNHPYFDFPDYETNLMEAEKVGCGKLEENQFEPFRNKGVVARAVLYFLLRYPDKLIGGQGYNAKSISMLIKWHNDHGVTEYELHRNQAIFKAQGNRNPFIDFPELAGKIKFDVNMESGSSETGPVSPNTGDDDIAISEINELSAFTSCVENQNPKPWKIWRAADSLKVLLSQINALSPGRKKDSDGMIGDLAHQSRNSDHNPWVWDSVAGKGVVTALDVTHDPAGKCDCNVLVSSIINNKDPRIKYVIWNREIINSSVINGAPAWTRRPYNGANPHNKHAHISVKCDKENYDSKTNWDVKIH